MSTVFVLRSIVTPQSLAGIGMHNFASQSLHLYVYMQMSRATNRSQQCPLIFHSMAKQKQHMPFDGLAPCAPISTLVPPGVETESPARQADTVTNACTIVVAVTPAVCSTTRVGKPAD